MVSFRSALAAVVLAVITAVTAVTSPSMDNLTDLVTWDNYSLMINGSRIMIHSGEFHYQRLPVPELWTDIFQKFKANGFNAVSIYFFWSYHSPSRDVFDFDSPGKDVQRLLDAAKEAGLWVIARPGPYCNAETNGGSLALWGSDGSIGTIRTSDETYYEAWLPWMNAINAILAKNQITNGGPVILYQIENELPESVHSATNTVVLYMEQLEAATRAAGIVVPFMSNEVGMRYESWSTDYEDVGGAVNIYGLDSYPGGTSCTNPSTGFSVVRTYNQWFANYAWSMPVTLPEFEGGWFSAWGASTFYDECLSEHSPEFADLYYKNNIGQRVTVQNIYMVYGGTNWGHSAAPVVYTSYDYSAGIRETRQQTSKLFQTKLINMFATSSSALTKTDMVGNGTGYHLSSTSAYTWVLQNPDTDTTFTVLQQASTSSTANISVSVTLDTTAGTVVVPDVALDGRQSKILVTDYALLAASPEAEAETHSTPVLLYSSADIATSGTFDDGSSALVMYLLEGQTGEFAFRNETSLTFTVYGDSNVTSSTSSGIQSFTYTQAAGSTVVVFSNGVVVYLLDRPTAWKFWAPPNGGSDSLLLARDYDRVFAFGPYLVRSASVDWTQGVVTIEGDSDAATTLEVYVGSGSGNISTIEWNGEALSATRTAYGSYQVSISGGAERLDNVRLPQLNATTTDNSTGSVVWYGADSLPEREADFDDTNSAAWSVCNKTTTKSPVSPLTLPVLFSSDYGFYSGIKVYRGRFPLSASSSAPTAVNITASGGVGFGWSAWLNGQWIGGNDGEASSTKTSELLDLPASALVLPSDNSSSVDQVITVLVDYHGHDETGTGYAVRNPRGLLGAKLEGGNDNITFSSWKIAGNAGGPANIDPVRGPMNEGGLYGERLGWHLPSFPVDEDAAFEQGQSPFTDSSENLTTPGVRFYVATFTWPDGDSGDSLDGLDIPVGIQLGAPSGAAMSVQLWINGYQYGKYMPQMGPQTVFPVPPGVLNMQPGATNRLALSVWLMEPLEDDTATGLLKTVEFVMYDAIYETTLSVEEADQLQPEWTSARSSYA